MSLIGKIVEIKNEFTSGNHYAIILNETDDGKYVVFLNDLQIVRVYEKDSIIL